MATIGRTATCAVLALIWVTPLAAQVASDRDAIRSQVLGFYRDDQAHRWPDVLDYFWVGKISARWTAPTTDTRSQQALRVSVDSTCSPRSGLGLALPMSIALIDDRWARVFVAPGCAGPQDELWMLRVGAEWRIARMIRAARPALGSQVGEDDHF